mgnify:CR=1 FL=1
MAYTIEVDYYNSFWLKNTTTPRIDRNGTLDFYASVFPGLPWESNTTGFPNWPPTTASAPYSNVYENSNIYSLNLGSNWVIEEARIRGGFNNTSVDFGPRAYLKEELNTQRYRPSALIYSGIYNSRTQFNETNVFSVGQDITRSVDPHNGSIQLIYAMDNNLTILQENKVSQGLIDKDTIYTTEGGTQTLPPGTVIGQITPYVGDYGISRNPESFAAFGFRRYFVDRDRNAVMRLSRDGLFEISKYGMNDYFRDELSKISDVPVAYTSNEYSLISQNPVYPAPAISPVTQVGPWLEIAIPGGSIDGSEIEVGALVEYYDGSSWFTTESVVTGLEINNNYIYVSSASLGNGSNAAQEVRFVTYKKDYIQGGYDTYKSNYLVSIQRRSGSKTDDLISDYNTDNNEGYYSTVAFDESVQGWTTFYTYRPDFIFNLKDNLYTSFEGSLYRHYDGSANHNEFYGTRSASSIEFIFNANPSVNKVFKTINYEGSNGWQVDSFESDIEGVISGVVYSDKTNAIKSYDEGLYYEGGIPYRAGFTLKEGKYFANVVNNSVARPGEVTFGNMVSGVKGYFAVVKMSTDDTTDVNGVKELFAASSEIVVSSR